MAARESIDLLNLPYGFVGTPDDAARLGLKIGVAEATLERAFRRAGGDFSTVPLMAAAGAEKEAAAIIDELLDIGRMVFESVLTEDAAAFSCHGLEGGGHE